MEKPMHMYIYELDFIIIIIMFIIFIFSLFSINIIIKIEIISFYSL
jgi:hypothetical protein